MQCDKLCKGHVSHLEPDNCGGDSQIPTLGGLVALPGGGKCLGGLMYHAKLPYLPAPSHGSLPTSSQKPGFRVPFPSSQTRGICSPIYHPTQGKRSGEFYFISMTSSPLTSQKEPCSPEAPHTHPPASVLLVAANFQPSGNSQVSLKILALSSLSSPNQMSGFYWAWDHVLLLWVRESCGPQKILPCPVESGTQRQGMQ